jgi:multidrug efflux pump
MPKVVSYLQSLRFDQKLRSSLIAHYITNPRLVILVVLLIILIGIQSFLTLPQTLNPTINIPIVIVSTVLPGAGPSDVESLITVPIEDAVSGVSKVSKVSSTSRESVSVTTLEFESGTDPDKARADVKSAVDTVTLPKDAKTPTVLKLDFTNEPIWTFSLSTNGDIGSLVRYSQDLQDRIKQLSNIDDVTTAGLEEQEIQIVIKPESIATYGLNPPLLSSAIAASLKSLPAGNVSTTAHSFSLSINPIITSVEDIRNLSLNLSGTTVILSDVADIYERAKPGQAQAFIATPTSNAAPIVTFNVFKTSGVDANQAYNQVKALMDKEQPIKNKLFFVHSVRNAAQEIADQFNELRRDFIITILLVFIVLFVFLGIRQALVASLAIPLTFFITFTVMKITGLQLSFIALFSLLLSLGLLVDDTIVVVSAVTSYHRTGKFTPVETGLLVWRDFLIAIATTTITTVWAFIPLLLATGIIGEFIKSIPIVVSTTLLGSFFVAMLLTLPFVILLLDFTMPYRVAVMFRVIAIGIFLFILFSLLPKGPLFPLAVFVAIVFLVITYLVRGALWIQTKTVVTRYGSRFTKTIRFRQVFDEGLIHFGIISERYRRLITRILVSKVNRRNAILVAILFSLFSYLLLPLGFVKNEFFPKSDQDFVFVTAEYPPGTNVGVMKTRALALLQDLKNTPEAEFVSAEIGQSFSAMGGISGGDVSNILFTIVLHPKSQRHLSSSDIGTQLRDKFASFSEAKISIVESTGGPPAGADLQIKLFGDNLAVLNTYADKLQAYLKKQRGVVNIDKSIKSGTSRLVFVPDQAKMANSGITADTVGLWLRIFASGFPVDTAKFAMDNNRKTDITVRTNPLSANADEVDAIVLQTQSGPVQLSSLGSFELSNNPTLITREDQKRTISVTAGVVKGFSISTLNADLEKEADKLGLPSGYYWATGGVNEENNKSVQSILQAMILSFLLIVVTMVIEFSSFRRAIIVMLVIPLSISGVFIVFAVTQTPLSFPALIGVLALFGIVVKNSILIVDKIVHNQKVGMPFVDAIADASASRLEAIALTSVATIMGLIPITLSDPIWRGLGGAIIAGLTFSGTIMLFFIPVVYYYWFAPKVRVTRVRTVTRTSAYRVSKSVKQRK